MNNIEVFKHRRLICMISTLAICICIGFVYAWSVLQNPIVVKFQWVDTKVTLAYTMNIICSNVIAMILGSIIRKISIRTCVLIGSVLFGLGLLATGFVTYIWQLYLFYGIVGGFGTGLIYPQLMSYVVRLYPERTGIASGIATAAYGSGAVIWAPVSTAFINNVGISNTFKILGIVFLIVCVAFSLLLKDPPEGFREALIPRKTKQVVGTDLDMNRGQMLKTARFYMTIGAFSCGLVAGVIIISNASPILQDTLSYTVERAALFVSVFSLCNVGGRFLWGTLSDRIGLYNAITGVFAVCILSMALLVFFGTEVVMIVGMGLAASCYGGLASMLTPFTGLSFGYRYITENFGCMFVVYGIASLIGPVLATKLKTPDGYTGAFLVTCALAIIGLVVVQLLRVKCEKVGRKVKK